MRHPPRWFLLVLLLLPALGACGDEAGPQRGATPTAARPARLADRIAASLADGLHTTLVARTDPRMLAALEEAEEVEILALYPTDVESLANSDDEEERRMAQRPQFHGYPVLGRAAIEDAGERERLATLIGEGIARSEKWVDDCFFPRHAVRLRGAGLELDLVICYECSQMNVYGLPGDGVRGANTSGAVEPRVTAFYERNGLHISDE